LTSEGMFTMGRLASYLGVTVIVIGLLLSGLAVVPYSEAGETIIVSPDPLSGDYTSIQSAIEAAQPGDTILVLAGDYSESIVIDKSLTIIGEEVDSVRIDGGGVESVVTITSSWVNLTNVSISNSLPEGAGILAIGVSNIEIEGNNLTGIGNGIYLVNVTNSTVLRNAFILSQLDGARIEGGSSNILMENLFSGCVGFGLNISSSCDNMISHNSFVGNGGGARDEGGNSWNQTYPQGGNYWDDHITSDEMGGPYQNIPQPDGIVDAPYPNISLGTSVDHYPLVDAWPLSDSYPPVMRLVSPANGSVIEPGEEIQLEVWDMNPGSILHTLDGIEMGEVTESYTINTTEWTAGIHDLCIQANDTFGNEAWMNLTYIVESSDFFVITSIPHDLDDDVYIGTPIMVFFSIPVDPSSITEDNYTLVPYFEHETSLSSDNTVLGIQPSQDLSYNTSYSITLTASILSEGGEPLDQTTISFTTTTEMEVEVSGRLLDVNNDPVVGADILFNNTSGLIAENQSDDDGIFNMSVPAGDCNITVIMEGEIILTMNASIELPGPVNLGDLDTMWDPGPMDNFTVIGRLLDVNGDPVSGAELIFESGDMEVTDITGSDGRFELEIPYGRYNITVLMEGETILESDVDVEGPGPIDLGDLDTMWDPGPVQPIDPTIALIVLIAIALGIGGFLWILRCRKPVEPDTQERPPSGNLEITRTGPEPRYHETELKPPVITPSPGPPEQERGPVIPAATEGKGKPCKEIIDLAGSNTDTSTADRAVSEKNQALEEARRALREAEGRYSEAQEAATKARENLEAAREEYENEVIGPGQRAEEAERKVREIERRLQQMRENIPGGRDVSFEPRPGWVEGGIGLGDMLKPISIWYRDREAMNEHTDRLRDIYYKEYKPLKKELEAAKTAAEEARRAAEEATKGAQAMENRIQQLESRVDEAEREIESAMEAIEETRRKVEAAESALREAQEAANRARELAESSRRDARQCEECLQDVRELLEEIAALIEKYESLKAGEDIDDHRRSLSDLDAKGIWDDWWDAFRRFRDEAKQMANIKNLADADIPSEFSGLWDWGGPVGTAVGYAAEDLAGAVIPTDAIKAVGGLYSILSSYFNPNTALGARVLMEELGESDYVKAAEAFNDFPRMMRDAISSFQKLENLRNLDREISRALNEWRECLDNLPDTPNMPAVDMEKLCLQQCIDIREELEELKRRLEDLIRRAEGCRPDDLEEKLEAAEALRRELRGIVSRMNRTKEGLELYRRAHTQRSRSRGCFISTAVYGTPLAPELDRLRGFRDGWMDQTATRRVLIRAYEAFSPSVADRLASLPRGKKVVGKLVALALVLIDGSGSAKGWRRSFSYLGVLLVYLLGLSMAFLMTMFRQ